MIVFGDANITVAYPGEVCACMCLNICVCVCYGMIVFGGANMTVAHAGELCACMCLYITFGTHTYVETHIQIQASYNWIDART